jgi:uncharacterized protein
MSYEPRTQSCGFSRAGDYHMVNFPTMHRLIETNREAIESLCRLHGVRSLEVFGSILRDDFEDGRSDVDVLVEFEPHAATSFSNFLDLKESLESIFGRSVDLLELRAIRNKRLRYYIEKSKSPVYVAA